MAVADATPLRAGRAAARVLWPLLFGIFVIGTGVMVVAGTLSEISGSLQPPRASC